MTPREKLMVTRLVNRLVEQPEIQRDPGAERELSALMQVRPDAAYLLFQRCLILEEALNAAHEEIDRLQQSGRNTAAADASAAPAFGTVQGGAPYRAAQPAYAAPSGAQATPAAAVPQAAAASPVGGFLRNAASMGAGVLGGSLLFQGIESLLHRGGGGVGGWGGNSGNGLFGSGNAPATEIFETVNNNYGDSRSAGNDAGSSFLDAGNDSFSADSGGGLLDADNSFDNDDSSWA
ncbi:MAG: transporter substrate-binding protein [Rhizobacter sp.]|nr:transporter substrate-binding protein [Rhizobacter sp.]